MTAIVSGTSIASSRVTNDSAPAGRREITRDLRTSAPVVQGESPVAAAWACLTPRYGAGTIPVRRRARAGGEVVHHNQRKFRCPKCGKVRMQRHRKR